MNSSLRVLLNKPLLSIFVLLAVLIGCSSGSKTWDYVVYHGYTLAVEQLSLDQTQFLPDENIEVSASGLPTNSAVIAAVADLIEGTTEDAVSVLSSFPSDEIVYVGQVIAEPKVDVVRYWGSIVNGSYTGTDRFGRWLGVIDQEVLYSPSEARALYALPNTNSAMNASWYRLKVGAKVVYGRCADMSGNTEVFGDYATGGAYQIYSPNFTTWNSTLQRAELNTEVAELVSDVRIVDVDE